MRSFGSSWFLALVRRAPEIGATTKQGNLHARWILELRDAVVAGR
jgi:hypothetical protein